VGQEDFSGKVLDHLSGLGDGGHRGLVVGHGHVVPATDIAK
jgi:hypothetical protein